MREFLETIWGLQGEGYAELRMINNEGKVIQYFDPWRDMVSTVDPEFAVIEGYNAFAGVLLRDRKEGTADAVKPQTPVLWADFDTKNFKDRMATFYAVQRIDIPPQIIVDSGHGFHAYWLLESSLDVKTAQRIMNGMADKYGSDKVGDPARVMRLPGTYNVKDPENPRLVRLVRYEPLERSRAGDFYDYIEEEKFFWHKALHGWNDADVGARSPLLDDRLKVTPPKGQRSEYIFGIVCDMVRAGWSFGGVYDTLMDSVAGEKVREMDDEVGLRWTQRTYESAQRAVRMDG